MLWGMKILTHKGVFNFNLDVGTYTNIMRSNLNYVNNANLCHVITNSLHKCEGLGESL